ncbi:hypothetical protein Leryth_023785 [Lithospermum erythrorhizon]|nr:hypothetical protein Leryth_023785 [Lithospermum erythrorhizon]
MGQALRRATGRIGGRGTQIKKPPKLENVGPTAGIAAVLGWIAFTENLTETVNSGLNWKLISYLLFVTESLLKPNGEVVPEEKDPQYNAMLSQMVGRIQAKPGGKPEMGELLGLFAYLWMIITDIHRDYQKRVPHKPYLPFIGAPMAVVVEKYDRPLPKVRNTTPESSRYEERPAPAGTLNVAQLRHIMLLYQGKADDHDGPMDIAQISARFRMDSSQVKRIVQSVSLLPEDSSKRKE